MPVMRKEQLVQRIPIKFVRVKNTSNLQIHVPFDGDTYVFNPGEELEVVESAFYFWTGDIKKDPQDQLQEDERMVNRWSREKLACRIDSEGNVVERVIAFPIPLIKIGDVQQKNLMMVGGQLMVPVTQGEAKKLEEAQAEIAELKKQLAESGKATTSPVGQKEPEEVPDDGVKPGENWPVKPEPEEVPEEPKPKVTLTTSPPVQKKSKEKNK